MGRRLAAVGALVVLILTIGFAVNHFIVKDTAPEAERVPAQEPAAPAAATEPAAPAASTVIEAVEGRAVRKVPGQPAAPVVKGDRLPAESTVETTGGTLTLLTQGGAQVVVSDESLLRVAPEGDSEVDLVLGRGRAQAKSTSGKLRMGFEGSDAVATVDDGEFSAVSDGEGQVAVASSRGDVELEAQGSSVTIGEGEQSIVRPSMPPSAPTAIPSSFFLKVRKPGTSRVPRAKLSGRTAPGSIVSVSGKPIRVGADGQFEAEVPLENGRNAVTISARDTQGREASKDVSIRYKRPDPKLQSKVVW